MSIGFSILPVNQPNGYPTPAHSHRYPSSHSMDRGPSDYSGLQSSSSYLAYSNPQSETASAEAPATNYQQSPSQDVRSTSTTYSSSATPSSEYGTINSASRTPTFPPDYVQRYPEGASRYQHPASTATGEPTIPAPSSATYHQPPQYTYPQVGHSMPDYTAAPPANWRPEWGMPPANYAPPHHMSPYSSPTTSVSTASSAGTASTARPANNKVNRKRLSQDQTSHHPLSQVYSFVPIPGAQQHKRPRRRYEEIERMYKCGWNGCEKAYGTLNHLNAHVTMQSHGIKRTPEEFKEIRKEWKARKKEEETQRKVVDDESRHRATEATTTDSGHSQPAVANAQFAAGIPPRQLPPIGYPAGPTVHYPSAPLETMQQYQQQQQPGQFYAAFPNSPYTQAPSQVINSTRQPAQQPAAEETDADAEPDPEAAVQNYSQ